MCASVISLFPPSEHCSPLVMLEVEPATLEPQAQMKVFLHSQYATSIRSFFFLSQNYFTELLEIIAQCLSSYLLVIVFMTTPLLLVQIPPHPQHTHTPLTFFLIEKQGEKLHCL